MSSELQSIPSEGVEDEGAEYAAEGLFRTMDCPLPVFLRPKMNGIWAEETMDGDACRLVDTEEGIDLKEEEEVNDDLGWEDKGLVSDGLWFKVVG